MNKDLKSLSKWLDSNKISLNITKTEVLIFKCRVFDADLKRKLCGKKLFSSKSLKYLGVILDELLQWNFHVNQLCLKLNKVSVICHYVNETKINVFLYYLPIIPCICLHCQRSKY